MITLLHLVTTGTNGMRGGEPVSQVVSALVFNILYELRTVLAVRKRRISYHRHSMFRLGCSGIAAQSEKPRDIAISRHTPSFEASETSCD